MMRRQPYTECKLFVDGIPSLAVGHYLRTPGGSGYQVVGIRESKARPGRRNLRCLRWPVDEIPAEAIVHELHWYKRTSKRGRRIG